MNGDNPYIATPHRAASKCDSGSRSAAALFAVSFWMIWADYAREWKDYQRRFNHVEVLRTKS